MASEQMVASLLSQTLGFAGERNEDHPQSEHAHAFREENISEKSQQLKSSNL